MTIPPKNEGQGREAYALLRRLSRTSGYLLPSPRSDRWRIMSCKNGYSQPVGTAGESLVEAMQREGMLVGRPDGGLSYAKLGAQRHVSPVSVVAPDGSVAAALINETEWAIGWLRRRRDASGAPIISDKQFAAAERLRKDYTLARSEPRLTASWERPVGTPGQHAGLMDTERSLAAKQRFYRALDEVGAELSGILLEVCCLSAGIEHAERSLGIPQRAGKAILQLALTRLARHYGIIASAHRGAAILHWAEEDYRPKI